jgi:hypothetical protein
VKRCRRGRSPGWSAPGSAAGSTPSECSRGGRQRSWWGDDLRLAPKRRHRCRDQDGDDMPGLAGLEPAKGDREQRIPVRLFTRPARGSGRSIAPAERSFPSSAGKMAAFRQELAYACRRRDLWEWEADQDPVVTELSARVAASHAILASEPCAPVALPQSVEVTSSRSLCPGRSLSQRSSWLRHPPGSSASYIPSPVRSGRSSAACTTINHPGPVCVAEVERLSRTRTYAYHTSLRDRTRLSSVKRVRQYACDLVT